MALIRSEEDLPVAATSEEEPPASTPTPAAAEEEEEEEEGRAGGDSEENDDVEDGNNSDSNNTTSTLTVRRSKRKKAAALKPTEVTEPYSTTGRKRPLEVEKTNKKNKKKKLEGSGKKKSVLDNQIKFNDADEIVVLNGILGYKNKGIDPSDINHEEFLTSIKKSLHFDANVVELGNKMRRFKTKFNAIVKKYGEDPIFSKTHESERFNLMKLIWGEEVKNDNGNGNEVKIRMKSTTLSSNSLFNEGLSLLGSSKVKEMDIKRRKLEMEELECYANRLDLEYEQTKAVLAALKAKRS